MSSERMAKQYELAREQYGEIGVDTEGAIERLLATPISVHCWQGDDVGGFEREGSVLSGGGIQAVGNYPGKARTLVELRSDLDEAIRLIPGRHRLNLHAIYGDFSEGLVDRDEISVKQFESWIAWAAERGVGLDFNPSYFSHRLAEDGFTLTHRDEGIRDFWIAHGQACREIAGEMGRRLGTPSVCNVWIPDGYKDIPIDRLGPRKRLVESLDAVFAKQWSPEHLLDSVESKLFGIGSESYVAGSHEFYLGYAIKNQKLVCLDSGHFHPTESIADKVSSLLLYLERLLLHVSRGVRWDSDHVVILGEELEALMEQIVRCEALDRVHLGLDFFDASINRVAAWVIGTRATQQALLKALLQPQAKLMEMETEGDLTGRLAVLEEIKSFPWQAVWAMACARSDVPESWLPIVRQYERETRSKRG